jgi:hypothetical protein
MFFCHLRSFRRRVCRQSKPEPPRSRHGNEQPGNISAKDVGLCPRRC